MNTSRNKLHVLALEPYFGGSHRAFVEGWESVSKHEWTVVGLPAHDWKWRMRHAAVTLSKMVREEPPQGTDVIFASDMLNLAEFRGVVGAPWDRLPTVVYFHENQLTYPVRYPDERDLHFAYTNFTTALAADQVWFNSEFHRRSFFDALRELLTRMPDNHELAAVDTIEAKSSVHPQGIHPIPAPSKARHSQPPVLVWAARWEHDKNPDLFFDTVLAMVERGVEFRVSVIGEQFKDTPEVFDRARETLAKRVVRWGFQPTREEYAQALLEADIVVSTAEHEFFGVSVVEAIDAGCFPLLPRRLAYPEILDSERIADAHEFFYDGTQQDLETKLTAAIERAASGVVWGDNPHRARKAMSRFHWPVLGPRLDDALRSVLYPVRGAGGRS